MQPAGGVSPKNNLTCLGQAASCLGGDEQSRKVKGSGWSKGVPEPGNQCFSSSGTHLRHGKKLETPHTAYGLSPKELLATQKARQKNDVNQMKPIRTKHSSPMQSDPFRAFSMSSNHFSAFSNALARAHASNLS